MSREARRANVAKTVSRLFVAHDLTDREASALTGVAHQHVQQWRDPDAPRAMPFADATALPASIRRALAEVLVGPGCVIVDVIEGIVRPASIDRAVDIQEHEEGGFIAQIAGQFVRAPTRLEALVGLGKIFQRLGGLAKYEAWLANQENL